MQFGQRCQASSSLISLLLLSAINCFGRIDYRIIVEKRLLFDNSILFLFSSMAYVINYNYDHDGHHPPYRISSNICTEWFILHYSSTSSSTLFVHPFTSVFLVVRSLVVYSVFHVFVHLLTCCL